ncbi:MAG: type IX secretion system membrane protein PorP/SprF [Saprospiraceae bacterium]
MKKIIFTTVFSFAFLLGIAQQEQQYTQFMYNKLGLNPGYAGSREATCLTGIYRTQWIGLEGAPTTQMVSLNMPLLNRRIGVGLNIARNTIGISERWTVDAMYAYRLRLGRGTLGIGIQGSIRYVGMDYSDSRLVGTRPIGTDGSIPVGEKSKYVPNFGGGLYYSTERFYIGLSAPRFLKNSIDFSEVSDIESKEVDHIYMMAGVLFSLSDKVDFQPQFLMKYADNSPLDVDVNASLIFMDKYTVGLTYRLGGSTVTGGGESLDLLLGAQLTDQFLFGLSYDITLSEIKEYSNGSVEAVVRYCFGTSEGEDIINPRFF